MILVIGATGTIGKDVVKGLKAKGAQVRAMVHGPEKATAAREPGVEYVTGDLEKPETVTAALQGVEKAFLLSPENPQMPELHAKFAAAANLACSSGICEFSGESRNAFSMPCSAAVTLSGFSRSPVTYSTPGSRVAIAFSGSWTIARTCSPFAFRPFTTSLPIVPVAPMTSIISLPPFVLLLVVPGNAPKCL